MQIFGTTFTNLQTYFICAAIALLLGAPIALTYTIKNARYSKGFVLSLYALPFAVMTVLMMIGNQVGPAIAIGGSFALIRFRSYPGTAREIINTFMSMAVGVILATTSENALVIAPVFTAIVCLINIIFSLTHLGEKRSAEKTLRVTIPESLDYTEAFDDLFEKYTKSHALVRVKTTNMGSMFQLSYDIVLKNEKDERAFLNELRCRNGNLDIICAKTVMDEESL